MNKLQNFINNVYYNWFSRKKFFKIKRGKIIYKIDNITKKIKWIDHYLLKKKLEELNYTNLISNFVSKKKMRRIDFNKKYII